MAQTPQSPTQQLSAHQSKNKLASGFLAAAEPLPIRIAHSHQSRGVVEQRLPHQATNSQRKEQGHGGTPAPRRLGASPSAVAPSPVSLALRRCASGPVKRRARPARLRPALASWLQRAVPESGEACRRRPEGGGEQSWRRARRSAGSGIPRRLPGHFSQSGANASTHLQQRAHLLR